MANIDYLIYERSLSHCTAGTGKCTPTASGIGLASCGLQTSTCTTTIPNYRYYAIGTKSLPRTHTEKQSAFFFNFRSIKV